MTPRRPSPHYFGRTITIMFALGLFLSAYQHGDLGNSVGPQVAEMRVPGAAIGSTINW